MKHRARLIDAHRVAFTWAEKRDPKSVEIALRSFRTLPAIEAGAVVVAVGEVFGQDASRRFLLDAAGYASDPGAWRAQARAHWRKYHAEGAA